MESVKTFVFFDLETTGLPQSYPKITEIALVAAGREDMLEKHCGVSKENNFEECYLPRVLNKLNFTVNPCKNIQPAASTLTGLTNENLEYQQPFDSNIFNILKLFLNRLEKPLCLVAHNGYKFDFPILKSELLRIKEEFPEDLFCVDTLPGFREVLSAESGDNDNSNLFNDIKPLESSSTIAVVNAPRRALDLVPKCGFSQEDYDLEMIKTLEVAERLTQGCESFNAKEIEQRIQMEMIKMRRTNETTPVRKPKNHIPPVGDHVRRKILSNKTPRLKFTLGAVYERVVRKQMVNSHRAESDTLALIECVTALGMPILEWMDCNKVPFRSIKKMW